MSLSHWGTSALLAMIMLGACERPRQEAVATPQGAQSTPQTQGVPGAEAALNVYLDRSVGAFPSTRGNRDSLQACPSEGMIDPLYTLASYRILSSATEGDTARVSAEVTTVVEESADPKAYDRRVARVRIATDTLTWKLVRSSMPGWKVCGIAAGGYDFGHYGEDAKTTWTPRGATWQHVQALVDSLRKGG